LTLDVADTQMSRSPAPVRALVTTPEIEAPSFILASMPVFVLPALTCTAKAPCGGSSGLPLGEVMSGYHCCSQLSVSGQAKKVTQ
jgi:hypothetical protein